MEYHAPQRRLQSRFLFPYLLRRNIPQRRSTGKIIAARIPALRFPPAARIFSGLEGRGKCPLTVREGREFLSSFEKKSLPVEEEKPSDEVAFSMKNVWQRYERNSPDILKGADIEVRRGEIFSLLGSVGGRYIFAFKIRSVYSCGFAGDGGICGFKRFVFACPCRADRRKA